MNIDTACGLQHPPHGQEPHGHETHERSHPVAVRVPGALDGFHEPRVVVCDFVHPLLMHVALPRPAVLEASADGEAVWCSMEITSLIERWISGNQVHALAVHGAEEG